MTLGEAFMAGFALAIVIGCIASHAAYTNGVTDGCGFAFEPRNPGYRRAGRYLRRYMQHRWPQLGNECYQEKPPT